MNEWISVNDKLPERQGRYLTHSIIAGQSLYYGTKNMVVDLTKKLHIGCVYPSRHAHQKKEVGKSERSIVCNYWSDN